MSHEGRGFPEPKMHPGPLYEYRVYIPRPESGCYELLGSIPNVIQSESHRTDDVLLALEDLINDTTIEGPEIFEGVQEVLVVSGGNAYVFELERPRVTLRLKSRS